MLGREEIGVFGYVGNVLESITNAGPECIDIQLSVSPDEKKQVCLQPEETLRLDVDIDRCIRQRFMPHVKTSQDLELRVSWIYTPAD